MFFRSIVAILSFATIHAVGLAQEYPDPPGPSASDGEIYEKAGLGSFVPYGEAGVLELGGSLSYITANDFDQISVSPSLGWFFADNFQISGIISYNSVSSDSENATYWTALAEPSYHLPFNNSVFGFAGVGVGFAHSDEAGSGTAIQPRLGANIMVGRSGILTPSLFTAYNTIDSVSVGGTNVLAVDRISGFNVGYTVIW